MKTFNHVILIAFVCLFFFSCEQENISLSKEPYQTMTDFYQQNGAPVQNFSISADNGGLVTGIKGTEISFPDHAFKDENGMIVTGAVTISLREVYSKSDMLLSNISTTSDGRLLKSGGMFSVTAMQGNQTLSIADGKNYSARLPSANPDPDMRSYIGISDSIIGGVNWVDADTSINDTSGSSFYVKIFWEAINYVCISNWLGWVNCDHLYPGVTNDVVTFIAADNAIEFSTQVYIVLETSSISSIYHVNEHEFPYNYAPDGFQATMVAVGLKDSTLYSAFVPFIVANNQAISFTLQPTTTDDFKAAIDALN